MRQPVRDWRARIDLATRTESLYRGGDAYLGAVLSPDGSEIAVTCADGNVYFLAQ